MIFHLLWMSKSVVFRKWTGELEGKVLASWTKDLEVYLLVLLLCIWEALGLSMIFLGPSRELLDYYFQVVLDLVWIFLHAFSFPYLWQRLDFVNVWNTRLLFWFWSCIKLYVLSAIHFYYHHTVRHRIPQKWTPPLLRHVQARKVIETITQVIGDNGHLKVDYTFFSAIWHHITFAVEKVS
jgi:hypothetical protein